MTTVKILIVDNNAGNLVALETCLQKLDAELVHAVNAEEALQHLLLHDFSLAIIDISVPDMDGYNLASLIHQNKQTRELPIIFLSTVFSDDIDFCESYSSGTVDFITKPFNPGILIAKVSIFLQMHLQRLKLKENILQLRVNENQILLQNKLLEEKTIRDDLTGVYNRRHLNTILKHEFDRCKRYNNDLTVLFFDLDDFKEINDTCGHGFGDSVIRQFASRIGNGCRKTDFIFRIGGEEFLALYPHTDIKTVVTIIAEKIQKSCELQPFQNTNIEKTVTVSIGAASFKEHHPEKANDLISFADHAMYAARNSGRNQIAIYKVNQS